MQSSTIVNSLGLLLDITGAVLLWQFGLPSDIRRRGESFLLREETDENQVTLARSYDRFGTVGLICLIVGFALQLISNFL